MIDAYLRSESDIDDHAIHLLFSTNRWELAYVLNTSAPYVLHEHMYMHQCIMLSKLLSSIHLTLTILIDRAGRPSRGRLPLAPRSYATATLFQELPSPHLKACLSSGAARPTFPSPHLT